MGVISDLYQGKITPFEDFTCSHIPKVVDLHEQIKGTESELLKTLSEEQRTAYDKIRADLLDVSCIEQEEMFRLAFIIGVQMGREVFGEG